MRRSTSSGTAYAGQQLVLLILIVLHHSDYTFAQELREMFGPRITLSPPFPVASVAAMRSGGEEGERLMLVPADRDEVSFYGIAKSGRIVRQGSLQTSGVIRSVARNESPSGKQMALFSPDRGFVQIIRSGDDTAPLTIAAPRDADRVLFADITNDGIQDLLFFGKKRTGIVMNRGSQTGFHTSASILLAELSVSDVAPTDLNGDRITDLFVTDWLSNKIILYLGIGRGVFSEQVSLLLTGEPSRIAIEMQRTGKTRVAVSIPDLQELHLFTVNSLGEFRPETVLQCPGSPDQVIFADINGNGQTDLVTATDLELVVFPQQKGRFLRDPFHFAAGGRISDWTLTDPDGDGNIDALLATREPAGVVLLGNSSSSGRIAWESSYAVGQSPRGLATGDFDGDGMEDLAVVSTMPGSLCLLMNGGGGRMKGPVFTRVGENPFAVKYVGREQANGPIFILSHYPSSHITVVHTNTSGALSSFQIPTALNPFVLAANIGQSDGKLSILVRNRGDERRNYSLSLYDEISNDQFIETNLRPNPPRRVTSMTAFDMSKDGRLDLVFSTSETQRGETVISLSLGVDRFSFAPHNTLYSFPDTSGAVRFVRAAYIDNDPFADVAVVLGPPMASLLLIYGSSAGVRDSVEWIRDVDIPREDAFIAEDLNRDGSKDLCFIDLNTQTVVALDGRGNGTFGNRRLISPARGVTALTTGSFSRPDAVDLWISNQASGTVTLISDPF